MKTEEVAAVEPKTRKAKDPQGKARSSFCIDETVLANARAYAEANNLSLSALVEQALTLVVKG